MKMTHACNLSISKTNRVDSLDMRATLLNLSVFEYKVYLHKAYQSGRIRGSPIRFPSVTPNTTLYCTTLHYYRIPCGKIASTVYLN